MIRFQNAAGQIIEQDASAELEEGLRSGTMRISSLSGPVTLRDPEGNRVEVDAREVPGRLQGGGFSLELPAQRAELERQQRAEQIRTQAQEEARANPITSGAEAFGTTLLEELSFGGSATTRTARERIEAEVLAEESPIASGAGTVAGILAPALAIPGVGLEASAGRFFLAAAADGAVGGIASAVTEANLDGQPIRAEQLMSEAAFGALLGLGTGGLLRGGSRAVRGGIEGVSRLAGYADDLARRGLGPASGARRIAGGLEAAVNPRAEGRLGQLAQRFSNVDADDLALVAGSPRRAFDVAGFELLASRAADDLAGLGSRVDDAAEALGDIERRAGFLTRAAGDASSVAPRVAREALDGVRARLGEGLEAFGGRGRGGRAVRNVLGELEGLAPTDAGTSLAALDRVVRSVDDVLPNAGDEGARALLREVRSTLANVAGEAEVFGGGAAAFSRLDGAGGAWRTAREALQTTQRDLAQELTERGAASSERIARLGESLDAADDVIATLSQTGGDVTEARRVLGAARETLGEAISHGEVRGAAVRGLAAEGGGALRDLALNAVGQATGRAGGVIGALLGGGPGFAIGRTVGGLAGTAVEAATKPVSTYRRIAQLGQAVERYSGRMDEGLARLRRVLESGNLERTVQSASRASSRVLTRLHASADERREEYVDIRDQLRDLSAEPERLESALAPNIGGVAEASPELADGLALTATRGVQYLAQQLPPADQVTLFGADLEPSQFEIDSFLRRYEAVEDPVSLLDRMAEGSLHVEHVEAAQAVYPQIMADVRARVTETLGELDEPPVYVARLQLGTLLGVAADPTLEPSFIDALQRRYAHTPAQFEAQHSPGAQVQPTGSLARVGNTLSSQSTTGTQSLEQGL